MAGRVTAVGSGRADVTAAFQGLSGHATITVEILAAAWEFLGTPQGNIGIAELAVDPRDDALIYVATGGDGQTNDPRMGVYRTADAGASWSKVADGFAGDVTIDPSNPDTVYAAANPPVTGRPQHGFVHKSDDAGRTWRRIAEIPAVVQRVLVSRFDPASVLVSGTFYAVIHDPPGVFTSSDRGLTWNLRMFGVDTPWLAGNDIAEDQATGTLYVANEILDHPSPYHPPVFKSTDRGQSWTDVGVSLPWDARRVHVSESGGNVFLLTWGTGLYKSTDQGDSWVFLSNSVGVTTLLDPVRRETIWGGNWTKTGDAGGVRVSVDGGSTFRSFGLEGHDVFALALNGDGTVLYAGCYDSGLYAIRLDGQRLFPLGARVSR